MDLVDSTGTTRILPPGEKPLAPEGIKEKSDAGERPRNLRRRRDGSAPPGPPEKEDETAGGREHLIDILV
jgi:hypothetical protein